MDYKQLEIKEYKFWRLQLHHRQYPYLGRACAFAIRDDAKLLSDMNSNEREELFTIIASQWEYAISELYGEINPDFAIFGNRTNHLHAHLIPRFPEIRTFYGIEFKDPNPSGNYSPYKKRDFSLETLLLIKQDIQKKLENYPKLITT